MTDIADKETPDIAATTAIGRGVNSFCLPHHVEQSRSSAKANCAFTLLLRQTADKTNNFAWPLRVSLNGSLLCFLNKGAAYTVESTATEPSFFRPDSLLSFFFFFLLFAFLGMLDRLT